MWTDWRWPCCLFVLPSSIFRQNHYVSDFTAREVFLDNKFCLIVLQGSKIRQRQYQFILGGSKIWGAVQLDMTAQSHPIRQLFLGYSPVYFIFYGKVRINAEAIRTMAIEIYGKNLAKKKEMASDRFHARASRGWPYHGCSCYCMAPFMNLKIWKPWTCSFRV